MSENSENAIKAVKEWDLENIVDLRDALNELDQILDSERGNDWGPRLDEVVDLSDLPSVEIPNDIDTGYPVWAMDRSGNCLVGDDLQDIESIDSIREYQAERRSASASVFQVIGFEMLEKIVKSRGTSGGVYVPPSWIGKKVAIIRLD